MATADYRMQTWFEMQTNAYAIYFRVTQCRSRNLFGENFLQRLFHSKKIVVENLYLFFNQKHKHLVIWFTVKEIRIKPF